MKNISYEIKVKKKMRKIIKTASLKNLRVDKQSNYEINVNILRQRAKTMIQTEIS